MLKKQEWEICSRKLHGAWGVGCSSRVEGDVTLCAVGWSPVALPRGWHPWQPSLSQPCTSGQLANTEPHFPFHQILDTATQKESVSVTGGAIRTRYPHGPAVRHPRSPRSTPLQWLPRPGSGDRQNGQQSLLCFWRQDPGRAVEPKKANTERKLIVSSPRTTKKA